VTPDRTIECSKRTFDGMVRLIVERGVAVATFECILKHLVEQPMHAMAVA
jgi:hypothetical protein